jgi:nucleoside-diphosphate kinase
MEKTFAIIKPDAVAAGNSGKIIDRIEQEGFKIIAMKKIKLTKEQAEGFYAVHKEKPFFNDLTDFMSSGPCIVMALEKENAIKDWRNLMGATNPVDAEEGTLRKLYGKNIDNNATHGSDAPETAVIELKYFFSDLEYTA